MVQHYKLLNSGLQDFLNSLDNAIDVPDTQAVGARFNLDTEICSEYFVYVGIHKAYQYFYYHRNNNFTDKNNNCDTASEDDNSFITNSDNEGDNSVDSTEYDDSNMDSTSNNDCSK